MKLEDIRIFHTNQLSYNKRKPDLWWNYFGIKLNQVEFDKKYFMLEIWKRWVQVGLGAVKTYFSSQLRSRPR